MVAPRRAKVGQLRARIASEKLNPDVSSRETI